MKKRSRSRPARGKGRGAPGWGRGAGAGEKFAALVKLQERLLAADGCPWDREQTHETLRTYLVEETYEVLEALESGDAGKFAEELGDLLLQVVFHAELARKAGRFEIGDVIAGIHGKMVRRHPHVFGEVRAGDAKTVLKNWEEMKREERQNKENGKGKTENGKSKKGEGEKKKSENGKGKTENGEAKRESLLDGVGRNLPAVLEAFQMTRRAARIGFDWENAAGVLEKVEEEVGELREVVGREGAKVEEEVGDLLFVAVNVARVLGVDPEIALKKANRKFGERFRWMEGEAERRGGKLGEMGRGEMEGLWNLAKRQGREGVTRILRLRSGQVPTDKRG